MTSSVLTVVRLALLAVVFVPAFGGAKVARSATPTDDGPWLAALQSAFVVLDVTSGDLDGDGTEETAVCYKDPRFPSNVGLAVLKRDRGVLRPAFHAILELTCESVKIQNGRVGIKQEAGARGPAQLVWRYGDQIAFFNDARHPLHGTRAEASETLQGDTPVLPAAVLDRNLATSWAEGASGTGIGESITLKLPRKTFVAYLGLYGGHGGGERAYYDHNRIHRASVKTQTLDDLGDEDTGINFADLGLEIGGDRVELSVENKPEIRYVRLGKRDVMQLELRIESVYLGLRRDDTHIAEIEVVPLLPFDALVASAEGVAASDGSAVPKKRASPGPEKRNGKPEGGVADAPAQTGPTVGERADKAIEALDEGGRSIVQEEDL